MLVPVVAWVVGGAIVVTKDADRAGAAVVVVARARAAVVEVAVVMVVAGAAAGAEVDVVVSTEVAVVEAPLTTFFADDPHAPSPIAPAAANASHRLVIAVLPSASVRWATGTTGQRPAGIPGVALVHHARLDAEWNNAGHGSGVRPCRTSVELNDPAVVEEVRRAFDDYEAALLANDVDALDRWFWDDERVVRFAFGDVQLGAAAISAARRGRARQTTPRVIEALHVNAFGTDVATAFAVARLCDTGAVVHQSQVWARIAGRWRIVAAHVSAP